MILDRKIEMLCLNFILSDDKIKKDLSNNQILNMISKQTELIDEFIKQYELPNLIKNPLKD